MRHFILFSLVVAAFMLGLAGPALAAGDDDIPGAPLAIGNSISQTVSSGDVNDVYAVTLTEGQEVHIRCDPGTAGGGSFRLLTPGVFSISGSDDYVGMGYTLSGGSFFRLWADFDYIPAKSGTYYPWVKWGEGTVNYSLSVIRTSRPPLDLAPDSNNIPGTPIGAGIVSGVVSTNVDEYDVYSVVLTAGQPVTMRLTALTSSSGYLTLLDPSTPSISSRYSHQIGDYVTATSNEPAEIQHMPTQTGTYYILVDVAGGIFAKNFPYQLSISTGGEPPEPPGEFSDAAGSPYETAIYELADRGIIAGFEDGTFRPNDPVSRQQFAKMIVKTLGISVTGSEVCPFVDVGSAAGSDPFYPNKYVAVCATHGITQGKTPTTFAPYDNITRQQLISMVARAAGLPEPPADYAPPFAEGQFYPAEHYLNARKAAYAGLLDGLQGMGPSYNYFAASTRGECAQLLYNLLQTQ
ncbi:MAG TPA: S-layer homology domain-containing protein [Thermoleophilia bacterium]|nr:S-layer homology domain-containing protein [Thermoleophilia bacterium]